MTPIAFITSRLSAPGEPEVDPIAMLASAIVQAGRKRRRELGPEHERSPEQPPPAKHLSRAETAALAKRICNAGRKARGQEPLP
jgi:hypothetical protein